MKLVGKKDVSVLNYFKRDNSKKFNLVHIIINLSFNAVFIQVNIFYAKCFMIIEKPIYCYLFLLRKFESLKDLVSKVEKGILVSNGKK